VSLGAIIPIFFSLFGIALASTAAPSVSFTHNPIILLSIAILAASLCMVFLPRINNWGWETKYFGASLFHLASLIFISLIPCLCIVFYSKIFFPIRLLIFIFYIGIHAYWCYRFITLYSVISNDTNTMRALYEEEDAAIYYMQKLDKYLLEKKHKFIQIPKGRYFVFSNVLSFSLVGFIDLVQKVTDLPFIHTFFLVNTLPLTLMAAGLATRSVLVFYYYPMQLKKRTSKQVYVDVGSRSEYR
jgi:hypothetical protein